MIPGPFPRSPSIPLLLPRSDPSRWGRDWTGEFPCPEPPKFVPGSTQNDELPQNRGRIREKGVRSVESTLKVIPGAEPRIPPDLLRGRTEGIGEGKGVPRGGEDPAGKGATEPRPPTPEAPLGQAE